MATINVVASAFHVSPASNTPAVAVRAHTSLVITASLLLASESHVLWRGYPPGSLKGVYVRFQ